MAFRHHCSIKSASPAPNLHHLHQACATCITRASTSSHVHQLHHARIITPRHPGCIPPPIAAEPMAEPHIAGRSIAGLFSTAEAARAAIPGFAHAGAEKKTKKKIALTREKQKLKQKTQKHKNTPKKQPHQIKKNQIKKVFALTREKKPLASKKKGYFPSRPKRHETKKKSALEAARTSQQFSIIIGLSPGAL